MISSWIVSFAYRVALSFVVIVIASVADRPCRVSLPGGEAPAQQDTPCPAPTSVADRCPAWSPSCQESESPTTRGADATAGTGGAEPDEGPTPMADLTPHIRALRDELEQTTTPDSLDRALTDRKSTRLNSSHVSISYAVFCL